MADRITPRRSPRALQTVVSRWNDKHPIGTPVTVTKDDGSIVQGETRSEAWVLSGHSAVIMITGVSGCYALERVKAVA